MGVAGQQQVITVGGEPVEHPGLGRVQHAEPQVGRGVGGPGDLVVAVPLDVRVVDAGHLDVQVGGLYPAAAVVDVQPAAGGHARAELCPGQVGDVPFVVVL